MRLDGKSVRALWLGVLAAGAVATGCASPTAASSSTILGLAVSPSPVTAVASSDPAYVWHASFSVTASDSAGVGGTLTSVTAQLHESSSGIIIVSSQTDLARIQVHSDTNVLPANGSTPINFEVDYKLPGGGREAVVDVTVALAASNGLSQTVTVRATIQ